MDGVSYAASYVALLQTGGSLLTCQSSACPRLTDEAYDSAAEAMGR